MSEIQSEAETRSAFDRRSVVKGAAWSVPVIAAAVAAPAAAASPPPTAQPEMILSGEGTPGKLTPGNRTLSAPTGFVIHNTSGAAGSTNRSITVTLERKAGTAGLYVATVNNAKVSPGTYDTNNVLKCTFTIPVEGATASQSFVLGYSHSDNANSSTTGQYTMQIKVTLPGEVIVSASSSKVISVS